MCLVIYSLNTSCSFQSPWLIQSFTCLLRWAPVGPISVNCAGGICEMEQTGLQTQKTGLKLCHFVLLWPFCLVFILSTFFQIRKLNIRSRFLWTEMIESLFLLEEAWVRRHREESWFGSRSSTSKELTFRSISVGWRVLSCHGKQSITLGRPKCWPGTILATSHGTNSFFTYTPRFPSLFLLYSLIHARRIMKGRKWCNSQKVL